MPANRKSTPPAAATHTLVFFAGLLLIAMGMGNVFYVGVFIRSAAHPYPVEIFYSHLLIFSGSMILSILFEFKNFNRWDSFYKAAKIAEKNKGRLDTLLSSSFAFLIFTAIPVLTNGITHEKKHLSYREWLVTTKEFYICFNLIFLLVISIGFFEICVHLSSKFKSKFFKRR